MLSLVCHESSQSDSPIFESLDAALRFAYRARPSTLRRSRLARMIVSGGDARPLRNPELDPMPHGYDAAGLVAEIKRAIEFKVIVLKPKREIPRAQIEQAHLAAKFAPGRVSREGQRALLPHVTPLVRDGEMSVIPEWAVLRFIARFYVRGHGRLSLLVLNLDLPQRPGEQDKNHHERRLRVLKSAERTVHEFLQSLATHAEESVHAALKYKGLIL